MTELAARHDAEILRYLHTHHNEAVALVHRGQLRRGVRNIYQTGAES